VGNRTQQYIPGFGSATAGSPRSTTPAPSTLPRCCRRSDVARPLTRACWHGSSYRTATTVQDWGATTGTFACVDANPERALNSRQGKRSACWGLHGSCITVHATLIPPGSHLRSSLGQFASDVVGRLIDMAGGQKCGRWKARYVYACFRFQASPTNARGINGRGGGRSLPQRRESRFVLPRTISRSSPSLSGCRPTRRSDQVW
jgi:hypothetical protein